MQEANLFFNISRNNINLSELKQKVLAYDLTEEWKKVEKAS